MPDVEIIKANKNTKDNEPRNKKVRVAAYCRVSTESNEQDSSYQLQIQYYTELIQNNPEWSFAGIFSDKISGLNKNRPEYQRMLKKCKEGKIDKIIVKSISRFGRNTVEILRCLEMLANYNVGVYFEQENIYSLNDDIRASLAVISVYAQDESITKGKNIQWGIKESFKSGNSGFQNLKCFGYNRNEQGELCINEKEAKIVEMIFDMYINGDSIYGIQKYLTENNYPSPTGKQTWSTGQLQGILANEKYTGNVLLQKTYVKDTLKHKRVTNKSERDQYLIKGNHEAIIQLEVFEKVQEERNRRNNLQQDNSQEKPLKKKRYCSKGLSGIIVCEECGDTYTRVTWSRNGEKRIVWRCTNRIEHGKKVCKNSPTILEEIIKTKIVDILNIAEYDEAIARQKIENIFVKDNGELQILLK